MSVQAVWIVAVPVHGPRPREGRLLFSRTFPTIIKKAKTKDGDSYVPIPPNSDFIKSLFFELGYTKEGMAKFITARDSCQREEKKPVFEISTGAGKLWPLVVVEQNSLLYCCLSYVEQGAQTRPPIIELPGVTLGFSLLCSLADFLRPVPNAEVPQKIRDLYSFLSQAAPFGTVLDTSYESVMAKMANRPSMVPKTQKQPSWKPVLHKGKNQIHLGITEHIRAVQYDRKNVPDVLDVYGTVTCKAELEGATPDITLTVSHGSEGETTPLDHLLIHPCVQSADAYMLEGGAGKERPTPRRLRFTPPSEMFTLCHYTVSRIANLPISGTFEMIGEDKKASVKLKLKLNDKLKNLFEYCELQIPFHNRGPVLSTDATPSHGNVMLSPDRRVLVWNIGQRFPKSLEITMSSSVQFGDQQVGGAGDPFCVGQNAYAQLYFKIPEFTHSGVYIDPKSIQVSPNMKFKLTTVREYMSVEYKLWNVHGDALSSVLPHCLTLNKEQEDEGMEKV